jgi:hypothetical protein
MGAYDGSGGTYATFFDGATSTVAQKISARRVGDIATDGTTFGVVTWERPTGTQTANLYFLTHNGSSWSTEASIGAATIPMYNNPPTLHLASSGSLWCVAYGYYGDAPVAWVNSSGTWTSSTLTGTMSFSELVGNNGTFALSTSDGAVSVYKAGAWDSRLLGSQGLQNSKLNRSSTTIVGTIAVAFANGGASTTGQLVTYEGGTGQLVTYEGGSWGTPFTVTTSTEENPAVFVDGSTIVTGWPEAGTLQMRRRTSGTWGSPQALPQPSISGSVRWASLARAGNRKALAVWVQMDVRKDLVYAAEHDGTSWGTPVTLDGITNPGLVAAAANQSTFLVGVADGSTGKVATWTGSGFSTPVTLGSQYLKIASDGSTFMATWSDSSNVPWSATSSNGTTWSTPIESTGTWNTAGLVGGPAGFIEWTGSGSTVYARVWAAGASGWSAQAQLDGGSNGAQSCRAAVGTSTALIVCRGYSNVGAKLYKDGMWTDVPVGSTSSIGDRYDGVDYRFDYSHTDYSSPMQSKILHDGVWSAAISNTGVLPLNTSPQTNWSAYGPCGWTYLMLYQTYGSIAVTHAGGSNPYFTPRRILPASGTNSYYQWLVASPGTADAIWIGLTPSSNEVPVLYVDLDM